MKKRILIGLTALCLILETGCSGGTTDKTDQSEATSRPETTSNSEPTSHPETTDETSTPSSLTANTPDENNTKDETKITLDQAKTIVLKDAGLEEKDGRWKKAEQDHEDGRTIYELEFISGKTEYEYEIDVKTGNILESKKESVDD